MMDGWNVRIRFFKKKVQFYMLLEHQNISQNKYRRAANSEVLRRSRALHLYVVKPFSRYIPKTNLFSLF